jgi:branched-chain amino acid transport system ATP-binding protein
MNAREQGDRAAGDPSPAARSPLLAVSGLQVAYGAVTAVHNVSLTVAAGQAVAVLGANGAGKSSALRAIAGLQRPSGGEVVLEGVRVTGWSTERLVRQGLALVTDTRDLFPRFSVRDNLRMGSHARPGQDFAAGCDQILELFPALGRLLRRPAWTLSGGEQQMLALGRALLTRPRLLLLDEPSLGLAPLLVEAIFAALARIVAAGTAVLLVEQTTAAALQLAEYAYVLRIGRVALEGPAGDLRHDPRVLDLYLGGEPGGDVPASRDG